MKQLYKNILDSVERDRDQNINRHKNSRVLIIDGLNTFIRCWSSIPTMNDDGDHVGGVTGVKIYWLCSLDKLNHLVLL